MVAILTKKFLNENLRTISENSALVDPFVGWLLPMAIRAGRHPPERWYTTGEVESRDYLAAALGTAGVYAPDLALMHLGDLRHLAERETIVRSISKIYVRHPRVVEQFLATVDLDIRAQEVGVLASLTQVRKLINSVGLFNNCLAQMVMFPTMRTELVETFYGHASSQRSLSRLIREYSLDVVEALQRHDYSLAEWAS